MPDFHKKNSMANLYLLILINRLPTLIRHPFSTVRFEIPYTLRSKVRTRNFSCLRFGLLCLESAMPVRPRSPRPRLHPWLAASSSAPVSPPAPPSSSDPPPWTTPLLGLKAQQAQSHPQAQGVARLAQPLRLTAARAPPPSPAPLRPGRPLPPPTHCLYLSS
jgi:hypothetical protein